MRFLTIACLAAAALGSRPGTLAAQLQITDVAIGFPAAQRADGASAYYKAGTWVPMRVRVRAGAEPYPGGTLWVETWDSDDVLNRYPATIDPLSANQERTIRTFARPGSVGAEIRVSAGDSKAVSPSNKIARALDFSKLLLLKLGPLTRDLQQAIRVLEPDPKQLRIRHTAHVDQADKLPGRWYGYAAVDLIVLTTANPSILEGLLRDELMDQRTALGEWVRRGGRLIISVSPRQSRPVAELLRKWQAPLAGVLTHQKIEPDQLHGLINFAETHSKPFAMGNAAVTGLRVRRPGVGPVEELARESEEQSLIVRGPHGLGSITLLAIDLDEEPFTRWDGRGELWQKLLTRLGPKVNLGGTDSATGTSASERNDIATDLQRELEVFPDVRPVSFGLVAFLIFLYILVVGPLDYFFLSKVVKRFHWTWVTFPVVVIGVTAAASLTAGSHQRAGVRANKIDLIDVDELGPRPYVQATSWLTLYSPDASRYHVEVTPAEAWCLAANGKRPAAVVTWLGRPEEGGLNSTGRPRSENLYAARYDYQVGATGLSNVPFPFASTKSFTASWVGPCPLLLVADLEYDPASPGRIHGTVTNRLPVELEGAILYYGGKWRTFEEPLRPGEKVVLSSQAPREFDDWMVIGPDNARAEAGSFDATRIVKTMLFHEEQTRGSNRRNNTLRLLDQSWRLTDVNVPEGVSRQAILFGRLPRAAGSLAEVGQGKSSPSRLRLGTSVPGGADQPAAATLTQDTYLRVYIPVNPSRERNND